MSTESGFFVFFLQAVFYFVCLPKMVNKRLTPALSLTPLRCWLMSLTPADYGTLSSTPQILYFTYKIPWFQKTNFFRSKALAVTETCHFISVVRKRSFSIIEIEIDLHFTRKQEKRPATKPSSGF